LVGHEVQHVEGPRQSARLKPYDWWGDERPFQRDQQGDRNAARIVVDQRRPHHGTCHVNRRHVYRRLPCDALGK
jgi:hypothetical protein